MHELSRQVIQAGESLKVTVDTFNTINYRREDCSSEWSSNYDFDNHLTEPLRVLCSCSSMLMNWEQKAESLDRRLHNEIELVNVNKSIMYLRRIHSDSSYVRY
jgi:hypothetical protein